MPNLQEWRDIVIVVYGALGALLLLVLIVVLLGLLFAVRRLTRTLQELVRDPLRPTLEELRDTMHNVRGTSEFIADTTVSPLIRAAAFARGIRRGVGVVSGVARRRN
ncbi:MAG: hypothetical protein FJ035_03905 [Chloroflexi bacterium]|nr:hypothetical protein [Chloroflexota bacterium]